MAFFAAIGLAVVSYVVVRFLGWDIEFLEFLEIFGALFLLLWIWSLENSINDLKQEIEDLKERIGLDE